MKYMDLHVHREEIHATVLESGRVVKYAKEGFEEFFRGIEKEDRDGGRKGCSEKPWRTLGLGRVFFPPMNTKHLAGAGSEFWAGGGASSNSTYITVGACRKQVS